MTALVVLPAALSLDQAITAWLHAKTNRSGSTRTERAYADTLSSFRALLQRAGQDLDSSAPLVALAAQSWAARGTVTPATFNQRLAILSSFYRYARQAGVLAGENPIDRVERRPVQRYATARALDRETIKQALGAIDRTTIEGQRDYCLLAVALQTGRRVAELAGLRWQDVQLSAGGITLHWRRCKGGKQMDDTLPLALSKAMAAYLHAVYGTSLRTLHAEAAIWVSQSRRSQGAALTIAGVRDICERHLGVTQVHRLRHTFAHTLEETGASLSTIQARLGHTNAATTGIYLTELRKAENPHADALAALLGLDG